MKNLGPAFTRQFTCDIEQVEAYKQHIMLFKNQNEVQECVVSRVSHLQYLSGYVRHRHVFQYKNNMMESSQRKTLVMLVLGLENNKPAGNWWHHEKIGHRWFSHIRMFGVHLEVKTTQSVSLASSAQSCRRNCGLFSVFLSISSRAVETCAFVDWCKVCLTSLIVVWGTCDEMVWEGHNGNTIQK